MPDDTLVKDIHTELYRGYTIKASLTRFGSLWVQVYKEDPTQIIHYCFNILEARGWLDEYLAGEHNWTSADTQNLVSNSVS